MPSLKASVLNRLSGWTKRCQICLQAPENRMNTKYFYSNTESNRTL
jgi:hypothetical protein